MSNELTVFTAELGKGHEKGGIEDGLEGLSPEQMRSTALGKRTFGEGIQQFCFVHGKLEVSVDSYAKVLTISDVKWEFQLNDFFLES